MFARLLVLNMFIAMTQFSFAEVPHLINFQGWATDANDQVIQFDFYRVIFSFYENEEGGQPVWSEVHNSIEVQKMRLEGIEPSTR
ncbi:MAG: hypothetical protein GY839_14245 [candidate division Zixibacteria bacterium]|nr:hypothetical protein [candidate division Zixibacteria bacterium]